MKTKIALSLLSLTIAGIGIYLIESADWVAMGVICLIWGNNIGRS